MERRTVILLISLLLAAAAFYLLDVRGEDQRARARRLSDALFPFDAAEVAEVRLSSGARLALDADPPRVSAAAGAGGAGAGGARAGGAGAGARSAVVDARADVRASGALLGRLLAARWERRLALPADSLAAFGLAPPRAWIALRARDGRVVTIDLGGDSPAGNGAFARAREAGGTGIVARDLMREAEREPAVFRDTRLLGVAAADVVALRLERPAGTLAVARDAEGHWRLTSPRRGRASAAAVAALLDAIVTARAGGFVDSLETVLAPSRRAILVTDGARDSLVVAVGAAAPGESLAVAIAPLHPRPVLVPPSFAALLDTDADRLRETQLFRNPAGQALAFEIAQGFDTLRAERVGDADSNRSGADRAVADRADAWRIVWPETLDADLVRVRALLRNLEIERIAGREDGASPERTGLDAPRAAVRLRFATPPTREAILFGAPAPGGGLHAIFEGEPEEVLVVPERVGALLAPDIAAFEPRALLAGGLDRAFEATLAAPGRAPLRLARDGAGAWRAAPAPAAAAPAPAAASLAHRLGRLASLDRFAAFAPDSAFGLTDPILSIEWNGPRAGRLDVGGALDPTRRVARLAGRRALYLLDAAEVDSLLAALGPAR